MVGQKIRNELHGEVGKPFRGTRPKSRAQGEKELIVKPFAELEPIDELSNGFPWIGSGIGFLMKTEDIQNHFPMHGVERIAGVTQKSAEAFPTVFEGQGIGSHREPHPGSVVIPRSVFGATAGNWGN